MQLKLIHALEKIFIICDWKVKYMWLKRKLGKCNCDKKWN